MNLIPEDLKRQINRVVYDEPNNVQNSFDSKFVWFVSASISPDVNYVVRCDDDFVRESLSKRFIGAVREPDISYVRCRNVLVSRVLSRLYGGNKMQSIFAGDYRHESIVFKTSQTFIMAISLDLSSAISIKSKELDDVIMRRMRMAPEDVETLTSELQDLRASMKRLRSAMSESGVCFLCASPITEKCGFRPGCCKEDEIHCEKCSTCGDRCPSCGSGDCISKRIDDIPIYAPEDVYKNDKADVLVRLINAAPSDSKIIVVSKYGFEAYRSSFPSGVKVTDSFSDFKKMKNEKMILLLDPSSVFATGMNIETTTDIVFVHTLDRTTEKQVIGRAQRPPRDHNQRLRLWYLRYDAEHVSVF